MPRRHFCGIPGPACGETRRAALLTKQVATALASDLRHRKASDALASEARRFGGARAQAEQLAVEALDEPPDLVLEYAAEQPVRLREPRERRVPGGAIGRPLLRPSAC